MNVFKILLSVLLILLFAGGVFLLVAFIAATTHNVSFVNQLKDWFGSKENIEAAAKFMLSLKYKIN